MSIDIDLIGTDGTSLYYANITGNLAEMAEKAGLYSSIWAPWQTNAFTEAEAATYAKDIIEIVKKGLATLKEKPEYFKLFNPPNGWGTYDGFLRFVERYLENLEKYPEATISVL